MKTREQETTPDYVSRLKDKKFAFNQKSFENAKQDAEKGFKREDDNRFWNPKRDAGGNTNCVFRFMPNKDFESETVQNVFHHAQHFFQLPNGRYFVENCPKAIGMPCPVCEENTKLWETGTPENKALYSIRKARKPNICNVYVKKDAVEPENEGKIFLYELPWDIYQMVLQKQDPAPNTGVEKANPFFPLMSPDFKLKITTQVKPVGPKGEKKPCRVYSGSNFSDIIEPLADDNTINKLIGMCYNFKLLREEKKFKIRSYEEIKADYMKALHGTAISSSTASEQAAPSEIKSIEEALKKEEEPKNPVVTNEDADAEDEGPDPDDIEVGEKETPGDEISINTDDLFS
jgi:hypothetical protein